jgi:hypothetical protein
VSVLTACSIIRVAREVAHPTGRVGRARLDQWAVVLEAMRSPAETTWAAIHRSILEERVRLAASQDRVGRDRREPREEVHQAPPGPMAGEPSREAALPDRHSRHAERPEYR